MHYDRPSLSQLVTRAETDLSARLLDGDTPLRRSVVGVLARVTAGQAHMQYGYLEWLAQQPFVDTAEAEYLARHARIWDVARKAAVAATGAVRLAGQDGAVLPAGTEGAAASSLLSGPFDKGTVGPRATLLPGPPSRWHRLWPGCSPPARWERAALSVAWTRRTTKACAPGCCAAFRNRPTAATRQTTWHGRWKCPE